MVGFAGKKDVEQIKNEVEQIKTQLSSLDENINTRIVAEQKLNRQKLTVELLSKWANNLDRPVTSTRKIVEGLGDDKCKNIIEEKTLKLDEKYKSLLEISLGKTVAVNNGIIDIDKRSVSILKWHLTTYLNSLESIMIAWQRGLVEPDIIENQFQFLVSNTRFTLFNYRHQLGIKNKPHPYPATEAFEDNLVGERREQYQQEKKDYLDTIKDDISKLQKDKKSDTQIIGEIVDKKLRDYADKKEGENRFKILRILISESAKALLSSTLTKKVWEKLMLLLL